MIYIILNIICALFITFFTHLIDSKGKADNMGVSAFTVAMLVATIESIFFVLVLIMRYCNFDALIVPLMRICLALDGISFVIVSFGIFEIGKPKKLLVTSILKYGLIIFSVFISFFKFTTIDISFEHGIVIASEYLIPSPARDFFPLTWTALFTYLYRYIVPVTGLLFLAVLQEDKNATQLEKYQTSVMAEGVLLMWVINLAIKFISTEAPAFSLLFIFSYLFMYVVFYMALSKITVPSGKAMFVTLFKSLVSYIVPAAVVGGLSMLLQPAGGAYTSGFITEFILYSIVAVLFSLWISNVLSTSSKLYTADYEASLEKDLASVDYKDSEMDQITAKMFEIMRRNVEASSMSVYILTGQNELDVAYSSNKMDVKIPLNNPMFDTLLNINKSIVIRSQIEKEHNISSIQTELEDFFKHTKSDALFILNEGHNIFGIITLGRKASGDHYKEYDYNVFVKLYSYFFVFGYYMRNISNKDVLSVVNREIKMSSQIITSIQENIDHVKTPKVDIGYLMVPAHNIGGEFIDMIRLTETRHLFVVGDLSGKGIAASMNMVILKSIIRSYLAEVHDFKQLVVKLNTFVRDSLPKGTIFAGLFALIDFETDTMYYINCGVPALMMYTQVYNNVIEIQGSGHILGFVKDLSPYISVKTTKLNHGDIIMACTDGLIQSHSLRGEQFGKERVQQAVLDNSTYPAQRMAQFTFDGLVKFMSKEMEDDVSILVIKYEGLPEEKTEETVEEASSENTAEAAENSEAPVEEPVDSQMEAVADETVTPESVAAEMAAAAEAEAAEKAEEPAAPESPAEESAAEKPADMPLPDGFEMPDLSDLDAMMKEAGL
ncbi:MAG: PP2C family protein-serine/threonine phosphatase [Treponema sp.]|nr:serine/threonine-protein phosphatase [Spirochaetia bacterium]MDD7533037.1 PP2C family protein-serine/threonine phosphatase [Treponema sp.]MDY5758946.1 PP2C family protein-serine/threonine phosphatase [Treponema sp.]MDY5818696.1 PP2C family protein-serine/threonine phosphatase [Treponema sp.]